MVNVGQNWRLDCNKSRHSEAELVPGRSIDTVSFCGWAPCHAEDALCENTSCKMPSSRMGNFFVMSSSSMASQSTLALATRIGWKPSALMFHFWIRQGGWFRGTPFRSPLQGGLKGLGAKGGGGRRSEGRRGLHLRKASRGLQGGFKGA